MISTPAQQLRPACSFAGLQSNMALGRGWGCYDKHTRSTAADQPAPLPDYKVTWLWGGGGGGGDKRTRSTAADQPAPLPDYKVKWLWGGGGWVGG